MFDDRLNKKFFSVINLDENQNDLSFWLNKTPQDRIAAIEMMRRINYGNNVSTARLQRVFEVAELSQG